jgi:excisionase family DNA binding protein
MTESDDLRLLSLGEAARRLGVHWLAVRELVETGQLRAVRIGSRYRIPTSALRDLGVSSGVSTTPRAAGATGAVRTGSDPVFQFKPRGLDGRR